MAGEKTLEQAFFDAIVPDKGHIFLVRFTPKRKVHISTSKSELQQAVAQETTGARLENSDAVYFTPNSFKTSFIIDPNGRKKTGRNANNAAFSRSVFVDLDCGEDKPYKTKQAALLEEAEGGEAEDE